MRRLPSPTPRALGSTKNQRNCASRSLAATIANATGQPIVALGDPNPIPFAVRKNKLRERPSHVGLKGWIEAILARIERAVEMDDRTEIARPNVVSQCNRRK